MILQQLILHKATAKIRSFFGNSIKKEEILGYHFQYNNSREDIYLIFSKTKKNLKKIFHILPTCFKKMHIYLQTLMS